MLFDEVYASVSRSSCSCVIYPFACVDGVYRLEIVGVPSLRPSTMENHTPQELNGGEYNRKLTFALKHLGH